MRFRRHAKVCPICACHWYAPIGSTGFYRCRDCGTDFGTPAVWCKGSKVSLKDGEWEIEVTFRTSGECPYTVPNPETTCSHPAREGEGNPKYCWNSLCPVAVRRGKK